MAYFQQIDELLNPNQKSSDILSPQQPGQAQNEQQQGAQQQQGSASTAITGAGPGAPSSSSSGAQTNKAEQGQSPAQYTQVGYNPKAYSEQNAGNQTDLNISKDVVSGAAKATEDLKQKSADFAASQPAVPQVSDEDINKAISGDKEAGAKVHSGLNPSPLTPEQKAPDFSSLSAPQILSSGDAISTQLQRAAGTGDYNRGMADFDRALYQKSDAYKADVARGQTAVTNFNQALQDEIDKWKGTDRGAELQAVKQQLQYKLGLQAQGIQAGVNAKLPGAQKTLQDQYDSLGKDAKDQFQSAIDAKDKEINDRLNNLVEIRTRKNNELEDSEEKKATNNAINEEMQSLLTAKNKLAGFKSDQYITKGEKPSIDSSFVTTQDDADKFNRIMTLLAGNGASTTGMSTSNNSNGTSPKLNPTNLKHDIDDLIQVSNDDYGWAHGNFATDIGDINAQTGQEPGTLTASNPLSALQQVQKIRFTAAQAAADLASKKAAQAKLKATQDAENQAKQAKQKEDDAKSYAEQKANDAKDWAQRQANNAGNAVNNVRKKLHF